MKLRPHLLFHPPRLFLAGLLLAVIFLGAACKGEERSAAVYRIGFMNCNTEPETMARFRPLAAYLTEKTGLTFTKYLIDDWRGRRANLNASTHIRF